VAFEQKEVSNKDKKPNTTFWTILRWYWILVPSLYFLFVIPNLAEGNEAPLLEPADVFNVLFQLLNLSLAGVMTVTAPIEQSKVGAADNILKVAAVQQFLVQNILGLILTVVAWYKLPYKVDPAVITKEEAEKWHFEPKTLYILTGIIAGITVLAIISQFALL